MLNIEESKEYISHMLDRLIENMKKDIANVCEGAPGVTFKEGVCFYDFEGEEVEADMLYYNLPVKFFLGLKWLQGKPGALVLSLAKNTENGTTIECVIKKVESIQEAPSLLDQPEYRARAVERFHKCANELTYSEYR